MKRLIPVFCAAVPLGILTGCSDTANNNHDADIQAINDNEVSGTRISRRRTLTRL